MFMVLTGERLSQTISGHRSSRDPVSVDPFGLNLFAQPAVMYVDVAESCGKPRGVFL